MLIGSIRRASWFRVGKPTINYVTLVAEAAQKQWLPTEYLTRLIDGEIRRRKEQAVQRRIGGPQDARDVQLVLAYKINRSQI